VGFTHSDHFQPGSKVKRAAVAEPILTTSTCVFVGVRVSSGESKLPDWTPAMGFPFFSRGWKIHASSVAVHYQTEQW
jgi:hypothetical protein